ncbi:MAG: FKBP-type peptidyl-prolyl cis-trans isomerase [Bacteroidales bacterium]|nr:FKBP-type peptidyl-prolyl cis-trans isomerase [Bacteroidales bacterium]MCF8392134.1 FKBP-type peptidyl-prolyl cis-trans isomerase [Bacteroidales bacterium]
MKFLNYSRLIIPIIASLLIFSCIKEVEPRTREMEEAELNEYLLENEITSQPTWTGLYYIEKELGTGVNAKNYDTVLFHYILSDLSGRVISTSEDFDEPVRKILGDSRLVFGLNEALGYMKERGKSLAIVPSTLGLGGFQYDQIDPYTTLVYDLELVEIKPGFIVEPFYTDTLTEMTTESGLKYYIVEQNTRIMLKYGDLVSFHYTGYLEDGSIFDSSVKRGEPATFQLTSGNLIEGWLEGVLLMKEGERFRFIIPPDLGYGPEGSFPIIPPNQNIIFDVEVIEII